MWEAERRGPRGSKQRGGVRTVASRRRWKSLGAIALAGLLPSPAAAMMRALRRWEERVQQRHDKRGGSKEGDTEDEKGAYLDVFDSRVWRHLQASLASLGQMYLGEKRPPTSSSALSPSTPRLSFNAKQWLTLSLIGRLDADDMFLLTKRSTRGGHTQLVQRNNGVEVERLETSTGRSLPPKWAPPRAPTSPKPPRSQRGVAASFSSSGEAQG